MEMPQKPPQNTVSILHTETQILNCGTNLHTSWLKGKPMYIVIRHWNDLLRRDVMKWNEQERKAPILNYRNRAVQFQKLDTLVLSRPVTVRGAVRLWWCASPPAKQRLAMERCEPWQLWRLKRQLIDLIDEKEKETRKLAQKYENKIFDWLCWR
jgi:hypothetical protein